MKYITFNKEEAEKFFLLMKEDPEEAKKIVDLDEQYAKWYNSTIEEPYDSEKENERLSETYKKWKIDNNY